MSSDRVIPENMTPKEDCGWCLWMAERLRHPPDPGDAIWQEYVGHWITFHKEAMS